MSCVKPVNHRSSGNSVKFSRFIHTLGKIGEGKMIMGKRGEGGNKDGEQWRTLREWHVVQKVGRKKET